VRWLAVRENQHGDQPRKWPSPGVHIGRCKHGPS
jgi:hypothetical protein